MPCVDSVTATNENALPISQTTAEHVPAGGAVKVRIRAARNCGAGLTDHIRLCNDAATTSGYNFDAFKTDLSYNNEITPGECTNWKDADGSNPLKVDLSDDAAHAVVDWKYKINTAAFGACERDEVDTSDELDDDYTDVDFATTEVGGVTQTIRLYPDGTSAGTLCGVSGTDPDFETGAITNEPTSFPTTPDVDPTDAPTDAPYDVADESDVDNP
jgi:hypothetical protein